MLSIGKLKSITLGHGSLHQTLHAQAFALELVGRWAKCKTATVPLPSPEAHAWCACWACSVDCTRAISGKLRAIFGAPNGHSIGPTRFAPQQFAPRPFAILGVGAGHALGQWAIPTQAAVATSQPLWAIRALKLVLLLQTCAPPRFAGAPALVAQMAWPLAMGAVVAGVACSVEFELWWCSNCFWQLRWLGRELGFVCGLKQLRKSLRFRVKPQLAIEVAVVAAPLPPSWWFVRDLAHPASSE